MSASAAPPWAQGCRRTPCCRCGTPAACAETVTQYALPCGHGPAGPPAGGCRGLSGMGPRALSNRDFPLQEPFDLVVVLAGPLDEDGRRVAAGVELTRNSEDRFLLLPLRHRALTWPWFVRHYRVETSLPEERVILGRPEESKRSDADLGGTFAEARKTMAVMQERGFRSAVIVTSGYHIRRARLAFERAGHGSGVRLPVSRRGQRRGGVRLFLVARWKVGDASGR
jgi:hypothetical protein